MIDVVELAGGLYNTSFKYALARDFRYFCDFKEKAFPFTYYKNMIWTMTKVYENAF